MLPLLATVGYLIIADQTINHRRLVQEVYDKGTLHHLVGISPKKDVPSNNGSSNGVQSHLTRAQRSNEARSVQTAWGEADMDLNSKDEYGPDVHYRDESDSKYDIDTIRPSRKRQRTGKSQDMHTVFMTDDDDDDEHHITPLVQEDSFDEEEREYDSDNGKGSERTKDQNRVAAAEKRRAYWASKGLSGGGGDDSS